jgi:hypothetical protein
VQDIYVDGVPGTGQANLFAESQTNIICLHIFFSKINFKIIIYAPADVHWVIPIRNDHAAENPTGIILVVAITIVLAMMVLLMAMQLLPDRGYDPTVPDIFQITKIGGINPYGDFDENYVVVMNTGDTPYDNRKLSAKMYRNGANLPDIPFINEGMFISVHPLGIRVTGGQGTNDYSWSAGARIYVDFSKGTLHPGDTVQFDVYDLTTNQLISRDTYPHDNGIQERCMRMYLSHQGA